MVAMSRVAKIEIRYETTGYEDAQRKGASLAKTQDSLAKSTDGVAAAEGRSARSKVTVAQMQERVQRTQEQLIRQYEQMERQAQAAAAAEQRAAADRASAMQRVGSAFASAGRLAAEHPVLVAAGAAASARALGGLAGAAATSLGGASAAAQRFANDNVDMGRTVTTAANVAARGLGAAETAATATAAGLARTSAQITSLTTGTGLVARGLGVLTPLLGTLAAAFLVFDTGASLIRKAGDDLERLVSIGRQAERLDMGASFVAQFQGVGQRLGLEVDQIDAALQRASAFSREEFGKGNNLKGLFDDLRAGGATGISSRVREQAELARTTDERTRLALAAMADLEASGQRLAMLKIGETVFGPDIADRLRRGETSVAAIVADMDRATGKGLVNQADVERATALAGQIADVKAEIGRALDVTFDFSKGALSVNESWLAVLKTLRDITPNLADAVKTGDRATMAQIATLQAQIDQARSALPNAVANRPQDVAGLQQQIAGFEAYRDQLSSTLAGAERSIDSMVGTVAPALQFVTDEMRAVFNETERMAQALGGADRALLGTAGSANAAGNALAGAAIKARSFADAVNAIDAANPNLVAGLAVVGKVAEVNQRLVEGRRGVEEAFNKGLINEAEAQRQIGDLTTKTQASIAAVRTEAEKPWQSFVRDADIGRMNQLDQSLARAGDRFDDVRKRTEAFYQVQIERADTPAARGDLEQRKAAALAQVDDAQKKVNQTARDNAVEKGASAAGKAAKDAARDFESFKDKAADAFATLNPADALRKQGAELQTELNKYRDQLMAIDPRYVTSMEAKIALNLDGKDIESIKTKTDDLSKDMAQTFRGVFDGMFERGNKGFDGMLDSITGGLSKLGSRMVEKNLISPLFSGDASNSPLSKVFDFGKIETAVKDGSMSGISLSFDDLLKPQTKANGQPGGFASSKLGSGLLSVGAGAAMGYQSGSALQGAVGGFMAGLSTGNPYMAAAGAAAGLVGGHFGKSHSRKKDRDHERRERFREFAACGAAH